MGRIRFISRVSLSLGLAVVLTGAAAAEEACGSSTPSVEGPAFNPENVCASYPVAQMGPITNSAMQTPDELAWQIFTDINKPIPAGSGVPFWRWWPEQAEVYPANPRPKNPPKWDDIYGVDKVFRGRPSKQQEQRLNAVSFVETMDSNPCSVLAGAQEEEVRINAETFQFIISNDLWFTEGKAARFASGKEISFPTTSREAKANWVKISEADKGSYVWASDSNGNIWGLVAMHFLSKEIPNWVWATFEHKSNPCYDKYLKAQDTFGLTADGKVSPELLKMFKKGGLNVDVYSNYRLDGAQVTFTDATGRPIILGNSVTEFGFQTTASCMTCHARASTDSTGTKSLSVFNTHSQSDHGTPDPKWYYAAFDPPTLSFMQVDFLWSVALCPNSVGTTTQNCSLPPVDQ